MIDLAAQPCTAFEGHRTLVAAPLSEVALAVRRRTETGTANPILVFDDSTGQVVDLDLRGSDAEILERLARRSQDPGGREHQPTGAPSDADGSGNRAPRGRGRPRLGVVAREVTLLPRHWDWLAAQPGGASAALRRLVDTARQSTAPHVRKRAAQEAAYRFMHAIAGDLPGYEEAMRALFADDCRALAERMSSWPEDIQAYALRLAGTDGPAC